MQPEQPLQYYYTGRQILKALLTGYPEDTSDIVQRQDAVEELAAEFKWRQRFLAEALIEENTVQNSVLWVSEYCCTRDYAKQAEWEGSFHG